MLHSFCCVQKPFSRCDNIRFSSPSSMLSCDLFAQLQTVQNVMQKINILDFITGALLLGMRPQEEAIYNFNFKCKNLFSWKSKLESFGADIWKNYVYSMNVSNLVKPRLLYDMFMRITFYLFFSSYYYYKGQETNCSFIYFQFHCWSLTIIIVWVNHKQWRPTDCLGVAKLLSKHWINYIIT